MPSIRESVALHCVGNRGRHDTKQLRYSSGAAKLLNDFSVSGKHGTENTSQSVKLSRGHDLAVDFDGLARRNMRGHGHY